MALSIKDPETDALVRKLARARKTSYTAAIRLAVSNELARDAKRPGIGALRAKIRKAQMEFAALPVLDPRSPDELIGYDEHGLPA